MESIAPVTATVAAVATRDLPPSPGGLTVGQIVQARVARVDGDTVLLRWGEQILAVTSKLPLTVGQQVSLMVEEGSAGKTLLRMLDDTSGKARPARADGTNGGRGTAEAAATTGGRAVPGAMGLPGRADRDVGAGPGGGQGFADPPAEWGLEDGAQRSAEGVRAGGPETADRPGAPDRPGVLSQSGLPGQDGAAGRNGAGARPGIAMRPGPAGPAGPGAAPAGPGLASSTAMLEALGVAAELGAPGAASTPGRAGAARAPRLAPNNADASAPSDASRLAGSRVVGGRPVDGSAGPGPAGGPVRGGQGGPAFGGQVTADPLSNLLFAAPDGARASQAGAAGVALDEAADALDASPASAARTAVSTAMAARSPAANGGPNGVAVLLARSALPAYGRLAQSIGGADAFGLLLGTLGHEAGQTLARAPLAPADVGRLLVDVGLHPDEMNAVLVSEMLTQGSPVSEPAVRTLRRELAAAGGGSTDAASSVLLSRLGLPVTPLSLGIARQLLAGQLDPRAAWNDVLAELQQLARGEGGADPARGPAAEIARDLLGGWRIPIEEGAPGVSRWLQVAVEQTAMPLEAKLARPLARPDEPGASDPALGQDVRTRLDDLTRLLRQPFASGAHTPERESTTQTLQRLQATIQSEQVLNGAASEPDRQRFFVVTLPALAGQQPGSLELRVRERDARQAARADVARPDVVRLKLSLPNLGDLAINLTVGQASISCSFATASAFAEALIGASSGELVGRLKRLGYQQTTVDTAPPPPNEPVPFPVASPAARVRRVDMRA